jgi:hypothetical protein
MVPLKLSFPMQEKNIMAEVIVGNVINWSGDSQNPPDV